MSLKKILGVALKVIANVVGFETPVKQLLSGTRVDDKVFDTLHAIAAEIGRAEIMIGAAVTAAEGQTNGPAKLAAVTPFAIDLILDSPIMDGKRPGDTEKFKADTQQLINVLVSILNNRS